ncbi:MAG TPA: exonuclease domain-containing protein [Steroidobacteraceae bacterium]|nr:exonuclease domain-containing protein [Steroidobacteraceae bacterium]HRX90409.1 exonuclease domain-containing protein [Steroidobacteraceae bacterium]
MSELYDTPVAFVDIETTGGHPAYHRITEIAVVGATGGKLDFEWSTLVNPGVAVPPGIQQLTGITNEMLADAPDFQTVAAELEQRLAGRLFIAHNARFDYGFIRREFTGIGREWQSRVLCTVKLSRVLYPEQRRHNLDMVIERHGLDVASRHRAMPDANALWQFWRKLRNQWSRAALEPALQLASQRPALPPQLPDTLPDEMPEAPGVYRFYGEGGALIYVGKAVNIRHRVMEHFRNSARDTKSQRLASQTQSVDWQETAGELGALLLEAQIVRDKQPVYNRRLRGGGEQLTWFMDDDGSPPQLTRLDAQALRVGQAFGLYRSERDARRALTALARDNKWCLKLLGLESGEGSCFGYQLQRCSGVCLGLEAAALHMTRVKLGLVRLQLHRWPYAGPVTVREARADGLIQVHVIDAWQHLATLESTRDASSDDAATAEVLAHSTATERAAFDIDSYRILTRALRDKRHRVTLLTRPRKSRRIAEPVVADDWA